LWDALVWLSRGHMPPGLTHVDLRNTEWLGIIPAVCGTLLAGWAAYNYHRFANATRRRNNRGPVKTIEAAWVMDTAPAVAQTLADHRRLVVHFNEQGTPIQAEGAGAPQALLLTGPNDLIQ
jgi:poly-beta-1,6-N-acetyl-D-glucosamine biosynthesis protein PgaD